MKLKSISLLLFFALAAAAQTITGNITSAQSLGSDVTSNGIITAFNGTTSNAVLVSDAGATRWFTFPAVAEVGPVPRPAVLKLVQKEIPPADYLEVAASIGATGVVEEGQILRAIDSLGLADFDGPAVNRYLTWQASLKNQRWIWRPLRANDAAKVSGRNYWATASVDPTLYARAVPVNVLAHVKAIAERIPNAIVLVSDYATIKPDPFLAITTEALLRDGRVWIVAEWDEPGFESAGSAPELKTGSVTVDGTTFVSTARSAVKIDTKATVSGINCQLPGAMRITGNADGSVNVQCPALN